MANKKIRGLTSKKSQDERIKLETDRLNGILVNIHESKRNIAQGLIQNIAFMSCTLADLQELIKTQGPVVKFEQGAQKMLVENPAQKTYNTMVNRYTTAVDKLFNLLPKDLPDIITSGLDDETNKTEDKLLSFQRKFNAK